MKNTESIKAEIEPILTQIALTLATIINAYEMPTGLEHGVKIGDTEYHLTFKRSNDGETKSSDLA